MSGMKGLIGTMLTIVVGFALIVGGAMIFGVISDMITRQFADQYVRCGTAQACGVLQGPDGQIRLHLESGVYPVIRRTTLREITQGKLDTVPATEFEPGCYSFTPASDNQPGLAILAGDRDCDIAGK